MWFKTRLKFYWFRSFFFFFSCSHLPAGRQAKELVIRSAQRKRDTERKKSSKLKFFSWCLANYLLHLMQYHVLHIMAALSLSLTKKIIIQLCVVEFKRICSRSFSFSCSLPFLFLLNVRSKYDGLLKLLNYFEDSSHLWLYGFS